MTLTVDGQNVHCALMLRGRPQARLFRRLEPFVPHVRVQHVQAQIDVLVVDDADQDAAKTIAGVRKGIPGCQVLRLRDGEQALLFIFRSGAYSARPEGNPQVVFLELELPLLPGNVVLERLRSDDRTREIPIVVLTSIDNPMAIEEAYALGADNYCVKPRDPGVYLSTVARLTRQWVKAPW